MTVDIFTRDQFLAALPPGSHETGVVQGEIVFYTPLDAQTGVMIRSSIGVNGMSTDAGEDSIRLWLVDKPGTPLAPKLDKYTTRVPGWEHRVNLKIEQLRRLREAAGNCPKCRRPMPIHLSKTPSNPNRLFAKCVQHNGFKWLTPNGGSKDDTDDTAQFERTMYARRSSACPWCRGDILIGEQIGLRGKQWGHVSCPDGSGSDEDRGDSPTDTQIAGEPVLTSTNPPTAQSEEPKETINTLTDALDAALRSSSGPETEPVEVEKVFIPSCYQAAIFEFVKSGDGHGVVEAVAGSGKTTTIVKALEYTPTEDSVAFVAFNRHIAQELQRRAPRHVRVSTLHSLGYANLRKVYGSKLQVNEDKLERIMDEWLPVDRSIEWEERMANRATRAVLRKTASLVRAVSLDWNHTANDADALEELAERYGVDLDGEQSQVFNLLPRLLERDLSQANRVIDYDDMLWVPIAMNLSLEQFDWLFIDEAQDLNPVQIAFVLRSVKPDGRVIAVGDRWQSLYGFRGADVEAIPNIINALHASTLPLSITYRCPTSHVFLAQELVPEIETRPDAPSGTVQHIAEAKVTTLVASGDMVICRTNAPLVPMAFELIRKGIKATVRGRDIGKGLRLLLDKMQADTVKELEVRLTEYHQREAERLLRTEKFSQLQQLEDKVETLLCIAAESNSIENLRNRLESLFSDEVQGVVLSSIHRAKGLEAERVFILRPDLLPHPSARKPWQQQQEWNCKYVALTRSKSELYFVDGGE